MYSWVADTLLDKLCRVCRHHRAALFTIEQCALLISHTGPSTWEHHQVWPLFGKLQHFLMDVGLSGICVQQQQR
jgi:hypothetical protein